MPARRYSDGSLDDGRGTDPVSGSDR